MNKKKARRAAGTAAAIALVITAGALTAAGIHNKSPEPSKALTEPEYTVTETAAATAAETTVQTTAPETTVVTTVPESTTQKATSALTTAKPVTKAETSAPTESQTSFRLIKKNRETTTAKQETTSLKVVNDFSCFENCAFIGNSRTLDLKDYGLVKNVYAAVGVNVESVYTKKAPGKSVPIMSEIGERHYEKYYLQFGENECGWPNTDYFIQKYGKIIDDIKAKDPKAKIYVQSILPISATASAKAADDCTNERIDALNVKLKQMAKDKNVYYVNVASAFKNEHGCLPEDAAADGIHFNIKYCKLWLSYLAKNT